jgi:hypothetical protein
VDLKILPLAITMVADPGSQPFERTDVVREE